MEVMMAATLIPPSWKELEQLGTDHVTCSRATAGFPGESGHVPTHLGQGHGPSSTISIVLGRQEGQRDKRRTMSTRGWAMAIVWIAGVCAFRGFTSTSPHTKHEPTRRAEATEGIDSNSDKAEHLRPGVDVGARRKPKKGSSFQPSLVRGGNDEICCYIVGAGGVCSRGGCVTRASCSNEAADLCSHRDRCARA